MCTVIIEVPREAGQSTRLLAVRDELPDRAWDPPGTWWPETPEVRGVRDRQAGGAWLAVQGGSLSVILNRTESVAEMLPEGAIPLNSRGGIVLQSIRGEQLPGQPYTESFNLIEVRGSITTVHQWDGTALTSSVLEPGVHMIAHGTVDDAQFARIATWLPTFQSLKELPEDSWLEAWMHTLAQSAQYEPGDDRAIIRDNTPLGYPTKSLLVCIADVHDRVVNLSSATLADPAHWNGEELIVAE